MHFRSSVIVNVPAATLWPIIANTEDVNRALGLPSVSYTMEEQKPPFVRVATMKVGFLKLTWDEYPFEWINGKTYQVRRDFHWGPVRREYGKINLVETSEGATKVEIEFHVIARNFLWSPLAYLLGRWALQAMQRFITKMADELTDNRVLPEIYSPDRASQQVRDGHLIKAVEQLTEQGVEESIVHSLHAFLKSTGSSELASGIRVYRFADFFKVERGDAFRAFLQATKLGVFEMVWGLVCPHCRVEKKSNQNLAAINDDYYCDFCGVDYAVDLESYTELKFKVHRNYLAADTGETYCIGSPARFPHVLKQFYLEQGDTIELAMPDFEGGIQLRTLADDALFSISLATQHPETEHSCQLTEKGWDRGTTMSCQPRGRLRVHNATGQPAMLSLERKEWDTQAMTVKDALQYPSFVKMCPHQVLNPKYQIAIDHMCILFTDLKDSTQMYDVLGDGPAFGKVTQHFEYLKDIIERHDGVVVKTIGDAVMGAFHSYQNGLKAALDMQASLSEFNAKYDAKECVTLKVGLHAGPVVAMTANNKMDYFGRTVNIASRLAGKSEGHDVIVTLDLAQRVTQEDHDAIDAAAFTMSRLQTELKGVKDKVDVVRFCKSTVEQDQTDEQEHQVLVSA